MSKIRETIYRLSLAEMIDVNIENTDGITIVELLGELDSVSAPEVQQQVLPHIHDDSKILLDMTHVTYMSSAGLRILLMMYRNINENVGKIIMSGLNDDVREVMSITGFLDYFTTVDSRHEGLQALH